MLLIPTNWDCYLELDVPSDLAISQVFKWIYLSNIIHYIKNEGIIRTRINRFVITMMTSCNFKRELSTEEMLQPP